MKKLLIIGMLLAFLAGCGHMAQESEFFEHNTLIQRLGSRKIQHVGLQGADGTYCPGINRSRMVGHSDSLCAGPIAS